MTLLEKLERKRREVDRQVQASVYHNNYDFKAADLRDLLDQVKSKLEMHACMEHNWMAIRQRHRAEAFVD